jgi:hypothetical protein
MALCCVCSHAFHKACVQSYAEHAIMRDGRWHVRCPGTGCAYHLYTSDVRELCGAASPAFTRRGCSGRLAAAAARRA